MAATAEKGNVVVSSLDETVLDFFVDVEHAIEENLDVDISITR